MLIMIMYCVLSTEMRMQIMMLPCQMMKLEQLPLWQNSLISWEDLLMIYPAISTSFTGYTHYLTIPQSINNRLMHSYVRRLSTPLQRTP